ncbi:MAG: efflux RND transporter permease subunit [Phycisphaerae bacterium]|nr:efflux RND transporter permease subunit [Phycisphaerae bacterium]
MRLIRTFVGNSVAANMLMLLILVGGLAAGFLIRRELFPEFSIDMITVTVPYPGAAPDDVEKGICLKIEDYLENIDGVEEVSSSSVEGVGTVVLELKSSADVRKVLDDVNSEIDKIQFPDGAEDPVVTEVTLRNQVIQVVIFGETEERTLKEVAQDVKEDLQALPDISQVTLSGTRDYEISVDVDEQTLRKYDITLDKIADAIRRSSFDLPAGRIKTDTGEFALRIVGQKYTAEEYKTIPVIYRPDGTVVYLRDIATVREAFEDIDIGGQFNGEPSVMLTVFKSEQEDAIKIANAVKKYIENERQHLPAGLKMDTWSDLSRLISDRLDMLLRNGIQGLILVVLVLWLFLGFRLSFWVAMGIPISILGAILVMYMTDQSLNMITMFGLIMTLGLIVDDAIVVGENIHASCERGEMPKEAAVTGTKQVFFPVIGAVMTTWLAFIPLLFLPGVMGKFIRQLPLVVIIALGFSLIECMLILPPHLAHWLKTPAELQASMSGRGLIPAMRRRGAAMRKRINAAVYGFINNWFMPLFRISTRYRYVTLIISICVLIVMFGAFKSGYIRITTFPKTESDMLQAKLTLPTGTPLERTAEITKRIATAALDMNQQTKTENGEPLVQKCFTLLGAHVNMGRHGGGSSQQGGHLADILVELLPSEDRGKSREMKSETITALWRKNVGAVPDAISLTFGSMRGGPGGTPLEMRVLANNTRDAEAIAEDLKAQLATFDGVSDIEDSAMPGKMELQITPKRKAYSLGIDQQTLASQLRDAFYGNESIEIQRGRDELKVMVRYPEANRKSIASVEAKRIKAPNGSEVPFRDVANVTMRRGYSALQRVGGKSLITVSADVNEELANADQIIRDLKSRGTFEKLTAATPGAKIDLRGQRHQQMESLNALKLWFPIALLGIYTILAAIFRSYLQPIIVMIAIPFGLTGAVIGHWIMGYDVTLLSMFGMVALAGIVVNDSLVLIDRINGEIRNGANIYDATAIGSKTRFRPIILTTITTAVGMLPLLLEGSFQAQFLKPMAVSISFGLMFATLQTLLVVPSLYLIGNDIKRGWNWLRGRQELS